MDRDGSFQDNKNVIVRRGMFHANLELLLHCPGACNCLLPYSKTLGKKSLLTFLRHSNNEFETRLRETCFVETC